MKDQDSEVGDYIQLNKNRPPVETATGVHPMSETGDKQKGVVTPEGNAPPALVITNE